MSIGSVGVGVFAIAIYLDESSLSLCAVATPSKGLGSDIEGEASYVGHGDALGIHGYALLLAPLEKVIEHPLVVCYTMERFPLNLECYEVALGQPV